MSRPDSPSLISKGSHGSAPIRSHGEREAERLVAGGLVQLGLVDDEGTLLPLRKGNPRKVALATVVKANTSVGNEWLAVRLVMGHNRSVSRLIRQGSENPEIQKLCAKLKKMFPCED